jgi:pyruvate dehydrogenase E1 component alpha subunit
MLQHGRALEASRLCIVIENNQYGMGTSVSPLLRRAALPRGSGYGIPGEQVDGMDVFTVQKAAKQALDYIRSGNGPYILEMMTYRYRGHSMSDPAKYRTKEEVESVKENRDPIIAALKEKMIRGEHHRGRIQDHRKANQGHRERGGAFRSNLA